MRTIWVSLLALGLILATDLWSASAQPIYERIAGPELVQPAVSLAGGCRPLDFARVDIEWHPNRGAYQLTVTGTKPFTNMEVSLSHESYSSPPAYWRTVVVGCVKNILMMPIAAPYYVSMPLDRFVGTRGVEIVGASRSLRRDVPRS